MNGTPAPDLPNLGMLIKLMKLTASSNDAEALLAVRKANEQLIKFGGDWEALLSGKVTVIGDPFVSIKEPDPHDIRRGSAASRAPTPPNAPPPPRPTPKPRPQPATHLCVRCHSNTVNIPGSACASCLRRAARQSPKPQPKPQPTPTAAPTAKPKWSNVDRVALDDIV